MENYLPKYDAQLELEIQETAGDQLTEVIVKYNGDIVGAAAEIGTVELLSENYAIITLPVENIRLLAQLSQVEYIEKSKDLIFMLDNSLTQSCIYTDNSYLTGNLSGSGVLVGIIDSGIDLSHSGFKNDDGTTRIKYIWDLSAEGEPPQGFNFGKEYTSEDINSGTAVTSDTIGHGTAVAGIIAGKGRGGQYRGIAYNSQIIAVKLNSRNGFARSTEIMRGIKYIIDKAAESNMPVVINISYGTNDGSHDGSSLFETYIDSMADKWKTSIVVASGNEGTASHHFSAAIGQGEKINVEFNVGANTGSLYLSLWKRFTDKIQIRLTAPDGGQSDLLTERGQQYSVNIGNSHIDILFGEPVPYNSGNEVFFQFKGSYIQEGIWLMEITGLNIVDGNINIWLPVREGQSPDTKFLSPNTDITLTLPSTALKVITVGGYNSVLDSVLGFSGRGYTRLYNAVKPDLVAPAYEITTAAINNSYDTVTGTSFAAPHVSGAVALLMEWGIIKGNDPYMYGERVKAYLQLGARRQPDVIYPNREWGFGRLCLENTLRELYSLQISTMEINNNGAEDKIYSNDFIDIAIEDISAIEIPVGSEDIFIQYLEKPYAIAHIKRSAAFDIFGITINNALGFEPYLMGLMQQQALEETGILRVHTQPFLSLRGNGTLVAVIDTGIDYKNSEFIYEDNTSRIAAIWDQTIPGNQPSGQYYGTEFTQEEINAALRENISLPTNDTNGHGTRLAEISAGRTGAAPDCELIVVKLKEAKEYLRQVHLLPIGAVAYQSTDVMTAVAYVYSKARELNKPVSVCIGLGTNQGGHKGYSIMERYLSNIASRVGVCISVPTGNEAIAQHHAIAEITGDNSYAEVEISVGENEEGFPIWIWNYVADTISVEIISPLGAVINRIQPQASFSNEYKLPLEGTTVYVEYQRPVVLSQDQLTIIRLTAPVSGIWRIRLYGESILIGTVHLWLPVKGFIREETVFLMPSVETTLTIPSSAFNVLSVGGWNTVTNSVYAPSGRGPTRLDLIRPIMVAPANVNGYMGTSIAAAIATGAAALMLQWGIVEKNYINISTTVILSYLIRGTMRSENYIYPNNVLGYGVLNLYDSFRSIL